MTKEIQIKTTGDLVEVLLKEEEGEETLSFENVPSQEQDIISRQTFLCPIGSCQFFIDSIDDESREKHFQQSHTNVDFSQMTFLKL